MPSNPPNNQSYTTYNIQKLKPKEHVRKRPGMYIGGTNLRALHHLVWAVTDHMIEEAIARLSSYISIQLFDNHIIVIESDATSLLYGTDSNASASERIHKLLDDFSWRNPVSEMHFGIQGGLHSLGLAIVTALSETFQLEIQCGNHYWIQRYMKGNPDSEVIYKQTDKHNQSRTIITVSPDFDILEENEFSFDIIASRLQDLSYLIPNFEFRIQDSRTNKKQECYISNNGLADWVLRKTQHKNALHEVMSSEATCEFMNNSNQAFNVTVQFAFQFVESPIYEERSFINTILTPDGGTHVEGLHHSIINTLLAKKNLKWKDINMGFVASIHLIHPTPEFEGRVRLKITNQEAKYVVHKAMEQIIQSCPDIVEFLRQQVRD